ncbi:MAG: LLM class F420-dependent oxidoreductase [Ilumatobacteraceae bacterium]
MLLAAVFPTTEIGPDAGAVRDWAQGVEDLGFDRIIAYDHVLGAVHEGRDPALWGPYTEHDPFHEPMVLFGYLAGITQRIELMTGVIILPQRQVALLAKQAIEVDLLSGGRLVLGVGIGWNYVEYEALGTEYRNRAARFDEQIAVLRALWDEPIVDFTGRYHRIDRAGLSYRPNRALPLWFGGSAEAALRRAAAVGDGFQFGTAGPRIVAAQARLRELVAEAGRRVESYPSGAVLHTGKGLDTAVQDAADWSAAGGTHIAISTMVKRMLGAADHACATVDDHLAMLAAVRQSITA